MKRVLTSWLLLMLLLAPLAHAASAAAGSGHDVHAFLDRGHVSLGDTVTLNIESAGALGNPDLSPLQKDFEVLGSSKSSKLQIANGQSTRSSQLGIALKPRHAGTLTIPALQVGSSRTQPLILQVGAAASGGSGQVGDPVFMEAHLQSSSPWVGQQTVYTVRLFYLPGVDGALGDPTADGARLVQLDRDHRYVADRDGYTYKVIERSWALIPQRSGTTSVQGPEFQGQRLGPGDPNGWLSNPNALLNNPNALLNGRLPGFGVPVHARAPTVRVEARAPPSNAGKPWLPARNVSLKLSGLPVNGKLDATAPLTVTLTISASGQPADALPEPELPAITGARVYPDQTRDATDRGGQWLEGTRTRSFAIVPERNGSLSIPAITLSWWNVATAQPEQATVPAHTLEVSGVSVGAAPQAAAPPAAAAPAGAPADLASPNPVGLPAPDAARVSWRWVALASLALWLLLVAAAVALWLTRRRRLPAGASREATPDAPAPAIASTSAPGARQPAAPEPQADAGSLRQKTLDAARNGDAAGCSRALLAWARALRPKIVHAGDLRDALSDPAQRQALDALEQARWRGGDAASACAMVAQAFANGFDWRNHGEAAPRADRLPPLYPSQEA